MRGVAAGLLQAGYPLRGMDVLMQGNVPIGAGLSSSAAVEMAAVQAFSAAGELPGPSRTGGAHRRSRPSILLSARTSASWINWPRPWASPITFC